MDEAENLVPSCEHESKLRRQRCQRPWPINKARWPLLYFQFPLILEISATRI